MQQDFFDEVYKDTFPALMRVAYNMTGNHEISMDICQEAFIKFFEKQHDFPGKDDARFWLIRVVKNLCLNYCKRKAVESRAMERSGRFTGTVTMDSQVSDLMKNETTVLVEAALAKLPEKLRIALVLREYAGCSYKEIGHILNITENNVKIRIFRARVVLAGLLNQEDLYVP